MLLLDILNEERETTNTERDLKKHPLKRQSVTSAHFFTHYGKEKSFNIERFLSLLLHHAFETGVLDWRQMERDAEKTTDGVASEINDLHDNLVEDFELLYLHHKQEGNTEAAEKLNSEYPQYCMAYANDFKMYVTRIFKQYTQQMDNSKNIIHRNRILTNLPRFIRALHTSHELVDHFRQLGINISLRLNTGNIPGGGTPDIAQHHQMADYINNILDKENVQSRHGTFDSPVKISVGPPLSKQRVGQPMGARLVIEPVPTERVSKKPEYQDPLVAILMAQRGVKPEQPEPEPEPEPLPKIMFSITVAVRNPQHMNLTLDPDGRGRTYDPSVECLIDVLPAR